MVSYFAEESDVRAALQESQQSFDTEPLGTTNVTAALEGASEWFQNATDGYFYDSNAGGSDLIASTPETVGNIELSVPSSPHKQSGQLFSAGKSIGTGVTTRYPNANAGVYVKMHLPVLYADTATALEVRERGGGYEDWAASADKSEGRGEDDDYFFSVDGSTAYGRSYLYLRASSIGPRKNFEDLILADIEHGLDEQDSSWADVRRGVAAMAAADLVVDDDVLTQIPDNGQLIGVDTQADRLLNIALGERGALTPYITH